jgi:tRNA(Arg) A34 adenosine deaminase TadA
MEDTQGETQVVITMPSWVDRVAESAGPLEGDEARMDLVVRLARMNSERGGGPFAAAVFVGPGLVAASVNRVLETQLTIAHAEVVALMRAQQRLAREGLPYTGPYTLVTSTEPCCQCFGAVIWSDVEELVCGAFTEDAEAAGFDEGPKPGDWVGELEKRGVRVRRGVSRSAAQQVLREYRGRLY